MNLDKYKLRHKTERKKLQLFNTKVYKKNKFQFYENEPSWTPVYIDIEKFNDSKTNYTTYFCDFYNTLLSDFCDALQMPYLFSFIPFNDRIDNYIFIKETSSQVKNKNTIIRKSAYLLHLVRTFENNDFDHSAKPCVEALFDYDDINTIDIVRNVLISYFIKAAVDGATFQLQTFKKNTKEVLKRRKAIEKNKLHNSKLSTLEKYEKNLNKIADNDLLNRQEASSLLKISLPTLNTWTKKGILTSYGIEGRVYYKREEVLDSLKKLKS